MPIKKRVCQRMDGRVLFEYEHTDAFSMSRAMCDFLSDHSYELVDPIDPITGEKSLKRIPYALNLSKESTYADESLFGMLVYNADLSGSCFVGSDVSYASFIECTLRNVDFSGCDLRGTKFTHSCLENSRFSDAQLGFYILGTGANFSDANLSGCDFSNADLFGAVYDSKTVFPKSFVIPHEMIFRNDNESYENFLTRVREIKTHTMK